MSDIQQLPTDRLFAHPDNPRLQLREDVVERLTAEINRNGFRSEHAILVRPQDAGWQIVSGHHRVEAASRAGLVEVPAWVREMDDDEAFMTLVLGNTQGELSPLEIGMHALRAVPLAEGGRGKRGGLSEYAERIGYQQSNVSMLRSAAEVARETHHTCDAFALGERTRHLYEVSKAPRDTWPAIAGALVDKGWTVAETAKHVEQVKAFNVPDEHADWLPLGAIVERYLDAPERFTPRAVSRLTAAADETIRWLTDNLPDRLDDFRAWLVTNQGADSWDYRAIIYYQQKLLAERWEVRGWHHGDWRDYLDKLDNGSVSLVLTDPPYGMSYQSGYRYKSDDHDKIAADGTVDDATKETVAALEALRPKLTADAHLLVFCTWRNEPELRSALESAGYPVIGSLVWAKNNTSMGNLDGTFAPKHERILHAVQGQPRLYHRAPDVLEAARPASERHPTEKPTDLLVPLIEATTAAGQLVVDPFAGVASTCAAAKESGRKWWGCELSEKHWRDGEERLS